MVTKGLPSAKRAELLVMVAALRSTTRLTVVELDSGMERITSAFIPPFSLGCFHCNNRGLLSQAVSAESSWQRNQRGPACQISGHGVCFSPTSSRHRYPSAMQVQAHRSDTSRLPALAQSSLVRSASWSKACQGVDPL